MRFSRGLYTPTHSLRHMRIPPGIGLVMGSPTLTRHLGNRCAKPPQEDVFCGCGSWVHTRTVPPPAVVTTSSPDFHSFRQLGSVDKLRQMRHNTCMSNQPAKPSRTGRPKRSEEAQKKRHLDSLQRRVNLLEKRLEEYSKEGNPSRTKTELYALRWAIYQLSVDGSQKRYGDQEFRDRAFEVILEELDEADMYSDSPASEEERRQDAKAMVDEIFREKPKRQNK